MDNDAVTDHDAAGTTLARPVGTATGTAAGMAARAVAGATVAAASWFRWNPDRVGQAVRACPGVVRLIAAPAPDNGPDWGDAAEIATYLPGRRVDGVRVRSDGVCVQVVAAYGQRLDVLAGRVREAVLAVAPDCPRVDVVIRDLEVIRDSERPDNGHAGRSDRS